MYLVTRDLFEYCFSFWFVNLNHHSTFSSELKTKINAGNKTMWYAEVSHRLTFASKRFGATPALHVRPVSS